MGVGDTSLVPPPQLDNAVQDIPQTTMEKVGSGVGGMLSAATAGSQPQSDRGSALQGIFAKHHAQKLAEAQMHQRNAANAAKIIMLNQDLNQPAGPDGKHPTLTDDQRQQYYNEYKAALAAYTKIAGVNPEAKKTLETQATVIDHHVNSAMQQHSAASQQPGGAPSPPPQFDQAQAMGPGGTALPNNLPSSMASSTGTGSATSASSAGGAGSEPSPKEPAAAPSASSQPGQSGAPTAPPQFQLDPALMGMETTRLAKQADEERQDARELSKYKGKEEFLYQQRIKEDEAKAKATRASHPTKPASSGLTMSVLDARKRAAQGEKILGLDGTPIDLEAAPKTMGLKGIWMFNPDVNDYELRYGTFSPNQRWVKADNHIFAANPMDLSKIPEGEGTYEGEGTVPIETERTAQGQTLGGKIAPVTTRTRRTPVTTPVPGHGPAPGRSGAPTTPPQVSGGSAPSAQAKSGGAAAKPGQDQQDIAIPFTAATAINKRITAVREPAIQILGDYQNPDAPSLKDYAKVADNPTESKALGNALQMTFKHMEAKERAHGSWAGLLANYGGLTEQLIDSERSYIADVFSKLSPRNQRAYNATMAAFAVSPGLRALSTASAAKFSVASIERELPLIGLNTFNSKDFMDKLAHIAEDIYKSYQTMPVSQAEKDYVRGFTSTKPKGGAPTKPPQSGKAAVDYDQQIMESIAGAKGAKP